MNNKGFVVEGVMAGVLIVGAVLAVFTLTPAKNLLILSNDNGHKSVKSDSYIETIEPYTMDGKIVPPQQLPNGDEVLLFKRTKKNVSTDEQTQPKLSLWQKIQQLGWWWLALSIAGFFIGPLGLIMGKINGKAKDLALVAAAQFKKKHEETVTEAKRIVLSVDEGLTIFDTAIASANASVEAATQAMAGITDPAALAAHTNIRNTYQAVAKALTDTKGAFLKALSTKQDESTKVMVRELRKTS